MKNRKLLKYHSYFGLISGVFLLILGISGAILVFNENIDESLFKEYNTINTAHVLNLDEAVRIVQQRHPKWDTRIVHFKEGETIRFNLRRLHARRDLFIHPETGAVIADIDANSQFTKWLIVLHYSLHGGSFGRVFLLIIGVLFLMSLLSGIVVYRKVIGKTLLFRVKLKRKNRRAFYSVLHRYIGVWGLFFNLVLVITGIVLSYGVAKGGLQKAAEPNTPKINISIEKSLNQLAKKYPDFEPTYIRLPKKPGAAITVNGIFKDDAFYLSEFYNKAQIDSHTGRFISMEKVREAPLLTKLNSVVSPLHYGQYGGLWVKLLYCIVGLSGPFLSVSGFIVWKKRKKSKRSFSKLTKTAS
ncbi:MAG TPA: PepSY domain-containing protein [Leeuwenhoekiella sp.]|nr:PepSY domain-containing protein [Leeuwenhoekiella sp.]